MCWLLATNTMNGLGLAVCGTGTLLAPRNLLPPLQRLCLGGQSCALRLMSTRPTAGRPHCSCGRLLRGSPPNVFRSPQTAHSWSKSSVPHSTLGPIKESSAVGWHRRWLVGRPHTGAPCRTIYTCWDAPSPPDTFALGRRYALRPFVRAARLSTNGRAPCTVYRVLYHCVPAGRRTHTEQCLRPQAATLTTRGGGSIRSRRGSR
mmetsp:Transcript_10811/g.22543  ORF Transcript_10811/g.22543 Transcript_10811/m.22543 type:complete len:204 (-) Transcript_10811:1196-1807(-)